METRLQFWDQSTSFLPCPIYRVDSVIIRRASCKKCYKIYIHLNEESMSLCGMSTDLQVINYIVKFSFLFGVFNTPKVVHLRIDAYV